MSQFAEYEFCVHSESSAKPIREQVYGAICMFSSSLVKYAVVGLLCPLLSCVCCRLWLQLVSGHQNLVLFSPKLAGDMLSAWRQFSVCHQLYLYVPHILWWSLGHRFDWLDFFFLTQKTFSKGICMTSFGKLYLLDLMLPSRWILFFKKKDASVGLV